MASARAALTALALLAVPASGWAQAPAPALFPRVDRAQELAGGDLSSALRQGGFVLLMRHARQAGLQQDEGCDRDNLGPEGHEQVEKVRAGLRALRVPIAKVVTSPICRVRQTAERLDVGPVELADVLKPGMDKAPERAVGRKQLLSQAPPAGTNVLLVSHGASSVREEDRVEYDFGEVIVYRPDGRGGAAPVARIKPGDWEALR